MLKRYIATLVSFVIAAAVGFATLVVMLFLPTFVGKSDAMVVWPYLGLPLGLVLGCVVFAVALVPIDKRVRSWFGS